MKCNVGSFLPNMWVYTSVSLKELVLRLCQRSCASDMVPIAFP